MDYLICKICNSNLEGNGYCSKHSTGGISYLENSMKEKTIIQFNISENNKVIVKVNDGIYKDEKIFKEIIKMVKSWVKYQIPHMEETMKNYEKRKTED